MLRFTRHIHLTLTLTQVYVTFRDFDAGDPSLTGLCSCEHMISFDDTADPGQILVVMCVPSLKIGYSVETCWYIRSFDMLLNSAQWLHDTIFFEVN